MSELSEKEVFFVNELLKWHATHRRAFPWRVDKTPYKVFVAEFFLQRTPAERVAKVYERFLSEFPMAESLAKADHDKLAVEYHELGLHKRLRWLVESAILIRDCHGGEIPEDYDWLLELPGVGEYTASAVMCFAFGRDYSVVDANVVRVLSRAFRLYDVPRMGNNLLKELAAQLVPKGKCVEYNEALLDFAALVCKKRGDCEVCFMNCQYR